MQTVSSRRFIEYLMNSANQLIFITKGKVRCTRHFHLGPRRIPDHLLYYLESGSVAGTVNGRSVTIPCGRLFWLLPGLDHEFRVHPASDTAKVNYIRFRLNAAVFQKPYLFQAHTGLLPYINDCLWDDPGLGNYKDLYARLRLSRLFVRAFSAESGPGRKKGAFTRSQRRAVLDFLLDNLHRKVSLQETASIVKLNANYFSRRFSRSFGLPFQTWMKQQRVRQAASLLSESLMNVSEAACQLGYDDSYFFSRQFKEVMGESPGRWRRHH